LTSLDDDKAEAVAVIDLAGRSTIADFMVIASGRSTRQVAAMAEHLRTKLSDAGVKRVRLEGQSKADWVLIDTGDIVVHLFRPEVRAFYNLDKMWGLDLPEELRQVTPQAPTDDEPDDFADFDEDEEA
jgi:ribosome-associated protein